MCSSRRRHEGTEKKGATATTGTPGTLDTMSMVYRNCRCMLDTRQRYRGLVHVDQTFTHQYLPVYDRAFLHRRFYDNHASYGLTTTNIDAFITARPQGVTGLMVHQLDGAAGRLTEAGFATICAYVDTKERAGLCRVVSLDEWLATERVTRNDMRHREKLGSGWARKLNQ